MDNQAFSEDEERKNSGPRQVAQVASIASYWTKLNKNKRAPHHINKDGVMGEMTGGFSILLRWRSSLWKLVWKQLAVYLLAYLAISLLYRFVLTGLSPAQQSFEKVVSWLKTRSTLPLTFLLGFYVSLVVKRWWEQYIKLPWPDEVATLLKAGITKGEKEAGENLRIRRTVVRYMVLSYVLCMRRISSRVRREYPDMDTLMATCLVRKDELEKIGKEGKEAIGGHGGSNWWLPIKWSISLVRTSLLEDRVCNPPSYSNLIKAIAEFRKCLTQVVTYGHVPVPLVYTQVVHLAVYFYFAVALMGRQWVQKTKNEGTIFVDDPRELDLYFPIFLTFEFLFYFGWLNVASMLYNPFGDDDDDFELMDLINRHIRVCMKIVDDDNDDIPEIQDDDFWRPPAGCENDPDWRPTLSQRTVQVKMEPAGLKRQWSRMSQAAVAESRKTSLVEMAESGKTSVMEAAIPEAIQEEPGVVSQAEARDIGRS